MNENLAYRKLMAVANDPELMDTFYQMVKDHYARHNDYLNCKFCKIFVMW